MIARRRLLAGLALPAGTGLLSACLGAPRSGTRAGGGASTPSGAPAPVTHSYGEDPAQVADLWLPAGHPGAARGVVALVHGGFWRAGYDRSLEDDVAADLVAAGWAVWNLDYRAVGAGGGWPQTFADVAAGVDLLAAAGAEAGLATDRVAVVGHSAGGTLALWAAARAALPRGATGEGPAVVPVAACSQSGVDDLAKGAREGLGDGAVLDLMGAGPAAEPERYARSSPVELVPFGVPLLAVSASRDDVVPPAYAEALAAAARAAGDDVRLAVVQGEDHFAHVDPSSRAWAVVRGWLDDVIPPPR